MAGHPERGRTLADEGPAFELKWMRARLPEARWVPKDDVARFLTYSKDRTSLPASLVDDFNRLLKEKIPDG
jgi:hypothetical protein